MQALPFLKQSPAKRGDCPLSPSCTLQPLLPDRLSQLIVGVGPRPEREWRVSANEQQRTRVPLGPSGTGPRVVWVGKRKTST
jgi:hypothetical protein